MSEGMPYEGEAAASRTETAPGALSAGPLPEPVPAGPELPPSASARPRVPLYVRIIGIVLILAAVVWVFCGLGSALVAVMVGGSHEVSATSSGSLAVSGSPTYVITAGFGSVRLVAGEPGRVSYSLTKRVRALTQSLAQRELDQITLAARQNAEVVTLAELTPGFSLHNAFESRSISLTISLPPQLAARITTSAGTLEVSNLTLTGDSQIDQTAGNVVLRNLTIAHGLTIRSTAGNLDLDGVLASGATLDVHLTSGNLTATLPHDTSAHLDARTDVGNLSVVGWPTIQTRGSSASGDLVPHPTGHVTLAVTAGNLTLLSR